MVIIGGDSFSAPYVDGRSWSDHLYKKRILNLAQWGAGNFYIADSIKTGIANNHKLIKKIIIFWSEFERFDAFLKKPVDNLSVRVPQGYWQFFLYAHRSTKYKEYSNSILNSLDQEKVIKLSHQQVQNTHRLIEKYNLNYHFGFVYEDEENIKYINHPRYIPITLRTFIKENKLEADDGHHPSAQGHKEISIAIRQYLKG